MRGGSRTAVRLLHPLCIALLLLLLLNISFPHAIIVTQMPNAIGCSWSETFDPPSPQRRSFDPNTLPVLRLPTPSLTHSFP